MKKKMMEVKLRNKKDIVEQLKKFKEILFVQLNHAKNNMG